MTDRKATIMSMVGEVLGSYRITASIDRGGMGNVFRAEHTHLGRPAAIKLLRSELTGNDDLVQRFFNEAKAATAIRHPGIVEVYDFGYTDDGRAYFAMELLEGETLAKRIEKGRFTERDAVQIARGLTGVLKAAHAKGIVHRDLKPDNIFLVPDDDDGDRVKVLDFGVAKLNETPGDMRHTQTGVLMGTPLYMAPEQARAASGIDHRADLYSVGCIMYEMLAGVPPFKAEGAGEIIALQMFADPQPLRERLAEITPELEALVMKLLEKEPDARHQSAPELYAALGDVKNLLAGEVAAERENANENRPRMTRAMASTPPPIARPDLAKTPLTLMDERPTVEVRKSSMPLLAAAATLGVAGVVVFFVLLRGGSEQAAKAPPDAAVVAPAPAVAEPAPVVAKPPEVERPTVEPVVEKPRQNVQVKKPTGAPVTRPDVANAPTTSTVGVTRPDAVPVDAAPAEVRTPITKAPIEESLDEAPKEPEPSSE